MCKFLLVFHCNHVSIMYRFWYSTLCPQNQLRVVQGQWRWHHSIDRIGVPIRLPFWLLPYLVLCTVLVSRYRNNLISIVLFLLLYLCPSYSEVFVKYHDFFHTTFYITSIYNPPSPLGKQVANIIFAAVFFITEPDPWPIRAGVNDDAKKSSVHSQFRCITGNQTDRQTDRWKSDLYLTLAKTTRASLN